MEQFELDFNKSKKYLFAADHMLSTTYPLIGDPKMLLAVINNLNIALVSILDSLLSFEIYYKRLGYIGTDFETKLRVFQQELADKYSFDKEFILVLREINEILKSHKESPVEFSKNGKFVICSESFSLKTISSDLLKNYIIKAKLYYNTLSNILKNDRIFG